MGSRDLRSVLLQSGSYLLSLLRNGGVHGGPLFCGRKGGETVQKENGRAREACQQEHEGYSVSRFRPGPSSGWRLDERKVTQPSRRSDQLVTWPEVFVGAKCDAAAATVATATATLPTIHDPTPGPQQRCRAGC